MVLALTRALTLLLHLLHRLAVVGIGQVAHRVSWSGEDVG